MASICRSLRLCSRAWSVPLSSSQLRSATRAISNAPRIRQCLGGVDSSFPLHSTIATARLKSNIALNSSCWSWLSGVWLCHCDDELMVRHLGEHVLPFNYCEISPCY